MKIKMKNKPLNNLFFAFSLIWHNNKRIVLLRTLDNLFQSIYALIPILFVREIIEELINGKNIPRILILAALMGLISLIIQSVSSRYKVWESKNLVILDHKSSVNLAEWIMGMSYEDVENSDTQDKIWLASRTSFARVFDCSMEIIRSVFTLLSVGALVFSLNPIILIIILFSTLISALIDKQSRLLSSKYEDEHTVANRKCWYLTGLMEFKEQGMDIRANNLEEWIYNQAEEYWRKDLLPIEMEFTKKTQFYQSIIGLVGLIENILIYVFLLFEVIVKSLSVSDFSMYLTSANTVSGHISNIAAQYSNLVLLITTSVKNYRFFSDYADKQSSNTMNQNLGIPENVEIEFRDVSFKYPKTETVVLDHINIKIKRGESLSVVGANGAGKTTFVKLLCRFYEPTNGQIIINGIPASNIPLNDYYNLLSVVFQDFTIFPFSLSENIAMNTEYEFERMQEAIISSGLDNRVATLPNGVDTFLSKYYDSDGIELSGGEAQKVAIARAIYRKTPIVIFDEPTSALDPLAEYEIYRRFHDLAKKRTTIFISHRLSSTKFTDKIAVFDGGTIKEYGTHDELINKEDGVYRKMFNIQAQYYI